MSKDRNIIRIDDVVKIITPNVFVRVGYPLNKKIVIDTLYTQEHRDAVSQMFKVFKIKPTISSVDELIIEKESLSFYDTMMNKILYALASATLKQNLWGGNERKIYSDFISVYQNQLARVISKKVVKTGIRYNEKKSYDYYDGEYDYEPAGLRDEKTHVILKVWIPNLREYNNGEIEIEKCNVVKMDKTYNIYI